MKRHASQTEFRRLVAEHGALGFGTLVLLVVMIIQLLRRPRTMRGRAVTASMMGFALFFMMVSGMRVAIPPFTFGFSFATLLPETIPANRRPTRHRRPAPEKRNLL